MAILILLMCRLVEIYIIFPTQVINSNASSTYVVWMHNYFFILIWVMLFFFRLNFDSQKLVEYTTV